MLFSNHLLVMHWLRIMGGSLQFPGIIHQHLQYSLHHHHNICTWILNYIYVKNIICCICELLMDWVKYPMIWNLIRFKFHNQGMIFTWLIFTTNVGKVLEAITIQNKDDERFLEAQDTRIPAKPNLMHQSSEANPTRQNKTLTRNQTIPTKRNLSNQTRPS